MGCSKKRSELQVEPIPPRQAIDKPMHHGTALFARKRALDGSARGSKKASLGKGVEIALANKEVVKDPNVYHL